MLRFDGQQGAALVGGAVFAFFPNKTSHALQGHINLTVVYWFPLLAWLLLRLLRRPSWGRGVGCGLALALALSVELVYVPFLVIPLVLGLAGFAVARLPEVRRSRAVWGGLGVAVLTAAPLVLPGYVPLLRAALQGELAYYGTGQAAQYSADLLGLFLPSPLHPVYGAWPALRVLSAHSLAGLLGSSENIVCSSQPDGHSGEEEQTLARFLEASVGPPVYQDAEALIFAQSSTGEP